jgi:polyketide cyclase/dehydrase/lipid transport protein
MREQRFRVQRQSSAPPHAIYALIEDVQGWTKWAPLVTHARLVREGSRRIGGAGAVRRVGGLGFLAVDEEILEDRPPHYHRYTIAQGLPVSTYSGEVHVEPLGSGSALLWTGTFTTRVPGLGPILRVLLGRAIGMLATGVVAAVECEYRGGKAAPALDGRAGDKDHSTA